MKSMFVLFFLSLMACSSEKISIEAGDLSVKDSVNTNQETHFECKIMDTLDLDRYGIAGTAPQKIYSPEMDFGVELGYYGSPDFEFDKISQKVESVFILDNFNDKMVLEKLFGKTAHYLHNNGGKDSLSVSWWICPDCKTDSIPYLGDKKSGKIFPDTFQNTTWVNGIYQFSFEERTYRFVSLASYPGEFAVMFTGRMSGAVMGYALFEKNATGWKLIDINRAVGMYGNYNAPMEPKIILIQNRPFFIYTCRNGWAGAPYISHADIFVLDRQKINKITTEKFLSCENNALGEWKTEYRLNPESGMEIAPLQVITYGYYRGGNNARQNYPYVFDGVFPALQRVFEKADSFAQSIQFIYTRTYSGNYGTRMGVGQFNLKTSEIPPIKNKK